MTAKDKIMTQHKNVFCAIAAAQLEFGAVTKSSTNPAFRSKYADLSDVASVVIPTLARHGVCVLHYLTGDDLGTMRTEFVHGETESRIHCDVPLIVSKNDMQGMKSATTYAKRIGLESLSGVAPDDDDGNAAAKAPPQHLEPQRRSGPPQEAFDAAAGSLSQAETVDALKAIWSGLPKTVQAHPEVLAAKDRRKADLDACDDAEREPVLADDEIPYGGGA